MTKIFSIFHLFHDKFESFFNLCGTNPEIQYHNVVIPQFYHTPKYTTPTLIKSQKVLLLGAGTLGSNVARCLLGWGVNSVGAFSRIQVPNVKTYVFLRYKFRDSEIRT